MKLALCHFRVVHGDRQDNLERLTEQVRQAAELGADIVVTPELSLSGYSYPSTEEIRKVAEPVPGETTAGFAAIARQFGCYVCLALAERDDNTDEVFNSAVALGPSGEVVARHRKITAERGWATAGTTLCRSVFDTPWARVGMLICSDTYYGVLPRLLATWGVQLLLVPANWPPAGLDPREVWQARARENGIFVAVNNRTGKDLKMDCATAVSQVIAPDGTVLAEGCSDGSRIILCELPAEALAKVGAVERPAFRRWQEAGEPQKATGETLAVTLAVGSPGTGPDLEAVLQSVSGEPNNSRRLLLLPSGMAGTGSTAGIERLARELGCLVLAGLPAGRLIAARPGEPPRTLEPVPASADPVVVQHDGVRLALLSRAQLGLPEVAFGLSLCGADLVVTIDDSIGEDELGLAGVRTVERLAVAVCTPRLAALFHPPEGHEKWREQRREQPGLVTWSVDLEQTRKKEYLPRFDPRLFPDEGDDA